MNKNEIELNLLFLGYQRQVSKAHTIFSVFFDILLGIIFGTLGIALSLIEIRFIPWNKFYFSLTMLIDVLLISIIGFIALYNWYKSRITREKITSQIKSYISKN